MQPLAASAWLSALLLAASAFAQVPEVPTGPRLDLAGAYRLAQRQDAALAAARAAAAARGERLPQARAQLLPTVRASLSSYRNELDSTAPNLFGREVTTHSHYTSASRALVLRQPLFRPYERADVRQAEAQVAEAAALLRREEQNLAVRLTTAYLQALAAHDELALVLAQRRSYEAQVDAGQKRFAAGAGTRTDIDEAQARLDLAIARVLQARQNLGYTREQLQMLTGATWGLLAPLDANRLALLPPQPADVQEWMARAEQGSPEIRVLQAQRQAAQHEIAKQQATYLPTLDLVAQRALSDSDNVTRTNSRFRHNAVGVELNWLLFSGGYVSSRVRQAQAELERVEQTLEAIRRDLSLRVYREFRGVSEGVLQVRALEQAVRSAETALQSTRRSWEAGARTQLDVLRAEEERVQALRDLAGARYAYLLARVSLRALAGEADQAAIEEANGWLAP